MREFLFLPLGEQIFYFGISAQEKGLFAGAGYLRRISEELQIGVDWIASDGAALRSGTPVFFGSGSAEQVARAEEMLLGAIGKPSGVATAAAAFVERSGGRTRIVCGAWKKVLPETRADLRRAIATGGAGIRIADAPFIYLDKNLVRMFGGIGPAVRRAREFVPGRLIVVQLRGERQPIGQEAIEAAQAGAKVLMVDTGNLDDLRAAVEEAEGGGWRDRVQLAFAGGVTPEELPEVIAAGADLVDVGRAIIDAPLLDFRLDVEEA